MMKFAHARTLLSVIWVSGFVVLATVAWIQSTHHYKHVGEILWDWLLPLVAPNFGLVVVANSTEARRQRRKQLGLSAWFAISLSVIYLTCIAVALFVQAGETLSCTDSITCLVVLDRTTTYLTALQVGLTPLLAVYFLENPAASKA